MICKACQQDLPEKSFPACGVATRTLANGETVRYGYREEVCRKCRKNQRQALGLCRCNQPLFKDHKACERCLKASRISVNNRCKADRRAALDYYGRHCAYCGETIEVFLTIDHINNDGGKHRKSLRKNSKCQTGINIGAWLRKNNYPSGFQVLCVNCNHAKSRIGEEALKQILGDAGRLITGSSAAIYYSRNSGVCDERHVSDVD